MKRLALIAVAVASFGSFVAKADDEKIDVKALETCVDNALKGYNDDDHKKFWDEFSKTADALKTKETYDALYKSGSKSMFGKLVKRGDLLKDKSVLTGETGLAQYTAVFEKDKKVEIHVNWTLDGKDVKLVQLQIIKP